MRQTDLTLNELIAELTALEPDSRWPRCLLVNEVGEILYNGEDKDGRAEVFLKEILGKHDYRDRFIAFCFLSIVKALKPETASALKIFAGNSDNQELIIRAQAVMKSMSASMN